jgi:hypothetical protein
LIADEARLSIDESLLIAGRFSNPVRAQICFAPGATKIQWSLGADMSADEAIEGMTDFLTRGLGFKTAVQKRRARGG